MASLFIFNPEHELALASNRSIYTPPKRVIELRKQLSLLPALYAGNSDFILLPPEVSEVEAQNPFLLNEEHFKAVEEKNLKLVKDSGLPEIMEEIEKVEPWGWNKALVHRLTEAGLPQEKLPDDITLYHIRRLSHRTTSIHFKEIVEECLKQKANLQAREIFSLEELEDFLSFHPLAYLKAPWSSSGRGIVVTDHISAKGLKEWAHGTIKHQGSLIAEPKWERKLDFATEWFIENHNSVFMGFSVFETSSRGKYHGNISGNQEELFHIISEASNFDMKIVEAQKLAIEKLISPWYNGPLGIDMLSDYNGEINPCVEINLRMTMGHLNLMKK